MSKALLTYFSFFYLTAVIIPQVNTEKFRITNDSLGFSVRADIDFTLMAGNTDFTFLGSNTRFKYNWETGYTFLIINGGFGSNNGVSFFSQALIHLRNVNSLNDMMQLEEFVQYDNNKQLLLLHRTLIGGGLRFKVLQNDELVMRIGTSTFFEQEQYDLKYSSLHERKTNVVRLSLYLTSSLSLQKDLTLLSTNYIQPAINEFKDVRILSDNAININLSKVVDFIVKLQLRFDNYPPDKIKRFDLATKLGLAVNF